MKLHVSCTVDFTEMSLWLEVQHGVLCITLTNGSLTLSVLFPKVI